MKIQDPANANAVKEHLGDEPPRPVGDGVSASSPGQTYMVAQVFGKMGTLSF